MTFLFDYIREGGFAMYVMLLIALVTHPLAIGAVVTTFGSRRGLTLALGVTTLVLAGLLVGSGVLGYVLGMRNVDEAVRFADPEFAAALRAQGAEEADNNLYFAVILGAFPLLAGSIALLRGLRMKPPPTTP